MLRVLPLALIFGFSQPVMAQLPNVPTDREILRQTLRQIPLAVQPATDDITIVKERLPAGDWKCSVYSQQTMRIWGCEVTFTKKQVVMLGG